MPSPCRSAQTPLLPDKGKAHHSTPAQLAGPQWRLFQGECLRMSPTPMLAVLNCCVLTCPQRCRRAWTHRARPCSRARPALPPSPCLQWPPPPSGGSSAACPHSTSAQQPARPTQHLSSHAPVVQARRNGRQASFTTAPVRTDCCRLCRTHSYRLQSDVGPSADSGECDEGDRVWQQVRLRDGCPPAER